MSDLTKLDKLTLSDFLKRIRDDVGRFEVLWYRRVRRDPELFDERRSLAEWTRIFAAFLEHGAGVERRPRPRSDAPTARKR